MQTGDQLTVKLVKSDGIVVYARATITNVLNDELSAQITAGDAGNQLSESLNLGLALRRVVQTAQGYCYRGEMAGGLFIPDSLWNVKPAHPAV